MSMADTMWAVGLRDPGRAEGFIENRPMFYAMAMTRDDDRPDVPDLVVSRAVLPFHLPDLGVRGRLVRLGPLADAVLSRHALAPEVAALIGKAMALVASLAAMMKFAGSFSLQTKGDGPVSMLLADCTDQGALRGYARLAEAAPEALTGFSEAALLGQGYLAFTLDPGAEMDRHQGIVALAGPDLAAMAEHYFTTSEQMHCLVRLACAPTGAGWRAAGLMLQRIAATGGRDADRAWDEDLDQAPGLEGWREAAALAATVTETELLDSALTPEDVLYRLFNQTTIRVDDYRVLSYGCRCSRTRLAGILDSFRPDELDEMTEGDAVVMTCEFCNYDFRFPRAGLRQA